MINVKNLVNVTRINSLTGFFLLIIPTYWTLFLLSNGLPENKYLVIFTLGAFFMRAAGCVVNDIFDKDIDIFVDRTKQRPVATGALSIKEAKIILVFLLIIPFILLFYLKKITVIFCLIALFLTMLYPLAKRFFMVPQSVLGIAFSFNILIVGIELQEKISLEVLLLFIANFFWILAYDTQYALNDLNDDLKLGINSSAIFFGTKVNLFISIFQLLFIFFIWLTMSISFDNGMFAYILVICICFFILQSIMFKKELMKKKQLFHLNPIVGMMILVEIINQKI
jgi:4-hydroxybenzoate polyprenyltransferase